MVGHAQRGQGPGELADTWTAAYQDYSRLFELEARESTEPVRHQLGHAAARVALAWRELSRTQPVAWWVAAAVELAATEFAERAVELGYTEPPPPLDAAPSPVARRPVGRPQRLRRSSGGSGYAGRSDGGGGE
ncbi:hypothetical protein [Amycolatopsis saalfeldensis]|uniref:Uncharacterized protein n=1 Tax=Amycolatopsis saalfeldensis TaxID=394193 RepID=A0A1H8QRR0_9PSEU|nr:hypothetical protein [Amycolatopsis saalfeldensis]SEO56688.1 hypothetical protein SAMN04489732_101456 [Amycolatopsis saalfeldensis]